MAFLFDRTMCPTGCILSTTGDMVKWMIYHIKLAKVSTTGKALQCVRERDVLYIISTQSQVGLLQTAHSCANALILFGGRMHRGGGGRVRNNEAIGVKFVRQM